MSKSSNMRKRLTAALLAIGIGVSALALTASPASAGFDDQCLGSDPLLNRWAMGQYETYTQVDLCKRSSDGAVYIRSWMNTGGWSKQLNLNWQYRDIGLQTDYLTIGPNSDAVLQSNVRNWTRISYVQPGLYAKFGWESSWSNVEWGSPYYF